MKKQKRVSHIMNKKNQKIRKNKKNKKLKYNIQNKEINNRFLQSHYLLQFYPFHNLNSNRYNNKMNKDYCKAS